MIIYTKNGLQTILISLKLCNLFIINKSTKKGDNIKYYHPII